MPTKKKTENATDAPASDKKKRELKAIPLSRIFDSVQKLDLKEKIHLAMFVSEKIQEEKRSLEEQLKLIPV